MSETDRPVATARRALWFSGMIILLAGIFGMHGLSSHAGGMSAELRTPPPQETASAGMSAAAPLGVHEVARAEVRDVTDTAAAVRAVLAEGLPGADMGVTAMCVAVLAVALTVLLRVLGDGPGPLLHWRASAPTRARVRRGRDPDPPSLIVLSIQRC